MSTFNSSSQINAAGSSSVSDYQCSVDREPTANERQGTHNQSADVPVSNTTMASGSALNQSHVSTNVTGNDQTDRSRRNPAPTARSAQPQTNPAIKEILTRLGPNATIEMLKDAEEAFMAAGNYINVDDVLPFHQAADMRRIGTTIEEINAAEVLLGFTLSEEAVEEAMDKGLGELRARARARRMG